MNITASYSILHGFCLFYTSQDIVGGSSICGTSLLKGVLGSLTGFTRWQRQYSDLPNPQGCRRCAAGEKNLPTKKTKASTSRSQSCQHAPPDVLAYCDEKLPRIVMISNFKITYSFSSVSCGTLVLTQRVIWLMFNGVMLALVTNSTQLPRALAPKSWAANGQLTNLNHRLGRVCWPNFTCKLVCFFFRLQILCWEQKYPNPNVCGPKEVDSVGWHGVYGIQQHFTADHFEIAYPLKGHSTS